MPPPPPLTTARDIPLFVRSAASSAERRITPSWTIAQLKRKLEPITGIPPASQKLSLKLPGDEEERALEAEDEEAVQVGAWGLVEYAEIVVKSLHPTPTPTATPQSTPKYTMPPETYASLPSTVLAYKKAHHIGRFDPNHPTTQSQKVDEMWKDIEQRSNPPKTSLSPNPPHSLTQQDLHPPSRCRISSTRHGTIAFVGTIPALPGPPRAPWIGIVLDEPVGKNDGEVGGVRYFRCGERRGVFVRPEKVEGGEWGVLGVGEGDGGEEEEEI